MPKLKAAWNSSRERCHLNSRRSQHWKLLERWGRRRQRLPAEYQTCLLIKTGDYSKPEQMASLGLSPAAVNAVIIHWNCTANVLYNLTRLKKKIREREHYEKIWSLYFPNNYGGTPQSSVPKIHLDFLLKARLKPTLYIVQFKYAQRLPGPIKSSAVLHF